MRILFLISAALSLLAYYASDGLAAVSNPEDFESYTRTGSQYPYPLYYLTTEDNWSSNRAGTADPFAAQHAVVEGQLLKMDNGADDNNVIWWQQSIFSDALQTLSYDVKLTDVYTAPFGTLHRSFVGPQTADNVSPLMVMITPTSGVRLQVQTGPNTASDWAVLNVGSAALDTWYSVELEFSSLDLSARMRYKETSAETWSSWTSPQTMYPDPDGWPIRFLSNDVVYYDNISLTVNGTSASENFESYSLQTSGPLTYKLTAADGWSGDRTGLTDPNPIAHNIAEGQKLEMNPGNENNNVIWWQQPVLTDELQRLSYDVKLTHLYAGTYNLHRSFVGPQTEDGVSPLMVMFNPDQDGNAAVRLQVLAGTEPDDWAVLDVGSASMDTWYSVELEFSSLDQWARIRYKETSGGTWSDWTDPQAMAQDPDGWPIRFLSNDVVYYDNVALSAVAYKPGDANMDGSVDANDAALLAQNWLVQENATWFMGDFNRDGKVDDADATLLAVNWGTGTASGNASVPEPGSLALLAISLLWLVGIRRIF